MLKIEYPSVRLWDEVNEEIITINSTSYELEHSLKSVFNWESKWKKSFLQFLEPEYMQRYSEKDAEEMLIDYIGYMILSCEGDIETYRKLPFSQLQMDVILKYIDDPQTATFMYNRKETKPSKQILTAEVIYAYMVNLKIPFECENWNLNRLLTLISVVNVQQNPEKMSKQETAAYYAKLNKARKSIKH